MFRRTRIVTCPETKEAAAVTGKTRLHSCSRWPERYGCDQACLEQIASSPDGCLLRPLVTSFYAGKSCVECGRAIDAPAALRLFNGSSHEWIDFLPQDLPNLFVISEPLCWSCNNVNELAKLRPNYIIRRAHPVETKTPLRCDNLY
jgi:hypothetical protein